MTKLAPAAPPKSELDKCVALHEALQKNHPDRFACTARCVAKVGSFAAARHCQSLCRGPESSCGQLAAPKKSSCTKALGKLFRGEVDGKGYECAASCVEKAPEGPNGLEKTVDCLSADCSL